MRREDEDIIMIVAGGAGERYGASVPKQYQPLLGRPVIEYVIEACKSSVLADAVLVMADPAYHAWLRETYQVETAPSGTPLNVTKRNGFDYIKEHSSCRKVIIVESVRPLIRPETLDQIFRLLDRHDVVVGARKITDTLGHHGEWAVDREEYYTFYPPQGFRFPLIDRCFQAGSPLTDPIQQLPETTDVDLEFGFPYLDKLTYPEDMGRLEALLYQRERERGRV